MATPPGAAQRPHGTGGPARTAAREAVRGGTRRRERHLAEVPRSHEITMSWQALITEFFSSPRGRHAVLSRLRLPRHEDGTATCGKPAGTQEPLRGEPPATVTDVSAELLRFLPERPGGAWPARITVRPVALRGGVRWQFTLQFDDHQTHVNLPLEDAERACMHLLGRRYRDAHLFLPNEVVRLRFNRKGTCRVTRSPRRDGQGSPGRPPDRSAATGRGAACHTGTANREGQAVARRTVAPADASSGLAPTAAQAEAAFPHDRRRARLIPEGVPCPYLEALGVMTPAGRVRSAGRKKFRQINRYLEFVRDVLPQLPEGRPVRIVDFGCGKSYLTFALYDWLGNRLGRDVTVVGIDRKASVVQTCRELVERLGWTGLKFVHGDAASFEMSEPVDMVISLHACDTATDAALAQAIAWGASVVLAAPCCRHEIAAQWSEATYPPLTRYGILRERLASIVTDVLRALVLELCEYRTQVVEFVDLEHTPQNVLIRATRRTSPISAERRRELLGEYERTRRQWKIQRFALQRYLDEKHVTWPGGVPASASGGD